MSEAIAIATMSELAARVRQRGDEQYARFLELEGQAAEHTNFQAAVIPGLVQTEEYARSLLRLYRVTDSAEWQAIRRRRHELWQAADKSVTLIVGEPALSKEVGGPSVMQAQMGSLIAASATIDIRILPSDRAVEADLYGSITFYSGGELNHPHVYQKALIGSGFEEITANPRSVARAAVLLHTARAAALNSDESRTFIEEYASRYQARS